MLFNSFAYIALFLPLTLVLYQVLLRLGRVRAAIGWLVGASLFYYGWWNPAFLGLIGGSILANYLLGAFLGKDQRHRGWLILGIAANLGLLGYFKYANFLADNLNVMAGLQLDPGNIVLPLAISFFTFQQIAFLVDAYRHEARELDLLNYALFVTFFPQLISGPIVHHKEMMPQFRPERVGVSWESAAQGIVFFTIGLFKKVVIADSVAEYSTRVFAAAGDGASLSFFEAWGGALAYTTQIYFDFSGYADMAIGSGLLFGIRLPLNFNSPYKSTSIVDFWRRWHMTLSRFLRDYLYIPLGGNRHGRGRRYINLMLTMLLGGLWHGPGWTFVLWGGLHGLYLCCNHASQAMANRTALWSKVMTPLALPLTFLAVVLAWIPFRAESMAVTSSVYTGMLGWHGVIVPEPWQALAALPFVEVVKGSTLGAFGPMDGFTWIIGGLTIAFVMPNSQEIAGYATQTESSKPRRFQFAPSFGWLVAVALMFCLAMVRMAASGYEEFLYRFF